MGNQKKPYSLVRSIGYAALIPATFAAGPVVGFFIGTWVDEKWATDPWGKTVMSLMGFIASTKQVLELIKRASKNTE